MTGRYGTRAICTAVGVGAGLMYLLDPEGGRRRRALLRDQLNKGRHRSARALASTGRDVTHRATGAATRVRDAFRFKPVDDATVEQRVHARIGHAVAHPGALEVVVDDGRVTVRGPVLQTEVGRLLSVVRRTPGVRSVVSELEVYSESGRVPALQGDWGPAPRQRFGRTSATTLLVGTAGALIAVGIAALALAADTDGASDLTPHDIDHDLGEAPVPHGMPG